MHHAVETFFPAPEGELPCEIFFNFATEGIAYLESVNGRTLNLPTTPLQIITDPNERQKLVEHEFCDNDPNLCKHVPNNTVLPKCKCASVEDLPVFGPPLTWFYAQLCKIHTSTLFIFMVTISLSWI